MNRLFFLLELGAKRLFFLHGFRSALLALAQERYRFSALSCFTTGKITNTEQGIFFFGNIWSSVSRKRTPGTVVFNLGILFVKKMIAEKRPVPPHETKVLRGTVPSSASLEAETRDPDPGHFPKRGLPTGWPPFALW